MESSISLFLLVAIALVLVTSSLNILKPRDWTMKQNLADAFLSREVALANRADFDSIHGGTSLWGAPGAATTTNDVVIGSLPGFTAGGAGRPFEATVHRVIVPIQANAAIPDFSSGSATTPLSLADLGIRSYELHSHVVYTIGGDSYVKSRTVIRSQ